MMPILPTMLEAEAEEIIAAALGAPIALSNGSAAVSVAGWREGRVASVRIVSTGPDGAIAAITEQEVDLLVPGLAPARLRAFVEGARWAAADVHARYGELYVNELLPVDLLACNLDSAEAFGAAIADPDRRASLVAPAWLAAFEAAHALPALDDPACATLLWWLGQEDVERWLAVSRELVRRSAAHAVPHLLCILEAQQAAMAKDGPYVFTKEDQNAWVVVARILEPLLGHAPTAELRGRLVRLWELGMFNPANL